MTERTIASPAFVPLQGAQAHFGVVDGAAYEFEKPDNWNGVLVVYIRGSQAFENTVSVQLPPMRSFLVQHGYAWAASSLDTTNLVTGVAARESAALVPLFSKSFRAPKYSLVMGASMGGGAAIVSAENYPQVYRGALAFCPIAGVQATYDTDSIFLVAAAYAEHLTQHDLSAMGAQNLMSEKIIPGLRDPVVLQRTEDIWIALTGGLRPFAAEGFVEKIQALGGLSSLEVDEGLANNRAQQYHLNGAAGISDVEFNASALRFGHDPRQSKADQSDVTGSLRVPTVTLTTTGDGLVPLVENQLIRRKVDAAREDTLLVQRTVQAAGHCNLSDAEMEDAFNGLVGWVVDGAKPIGEDVLVPGLSLGARFTRS